MQVLGLFLDTYNAFLHSTCKHAADSCRPQLQATAPDSKRNGYDASNGYDLHDSYDGETRNLNHTPEALTPLP